MLSLSFARRLAVMLALVLICVSTASQARTHTTRAEIGVVVAVDQNLQDRPNSWYAPGKVTGGVVAGAVGRRLARNSRSRNEITAILTALGTAAGSAYDRREVKGWMTVVQYADGSVAEVETAVRPNVRVGDSVYVANNGALVRAPQYVNGDARPHVTFARASGEESEARSTRTSRERSNREYRIRTARNSDDW